MRPALFAALILLPTVAFAQGTPLSPSAIDKLTPQEAARLHEAAKSDPAARKALDELERKLVESGHRSGKILEQTRR
jgi:hypothetical protein